MSALPPLQQRSNAIRVPSGDQDGFPSIWSPCVRRFIAFPSGATAKICGNPPGRVLENAIRVPSGDHDGDRSSAVLLPPSVNCRSSVPSAFITKSRKGPPASVRLAYTICVPSGDQAGSRSASVLCVSAPPPLPSAFITKMSGRPPAWNDRAKATRSPSGDQAGSISWAGFPERFDWPEPSAGIA